MEQLLVPQPLVDGAELPEQWKRFKRDFELFLIACEKGDAADGVKVALLLRTVGSRGNDIYDSFRWAQAADKTVYATVLTKFAEFCAPRVNTVAMTHKLLTTKQGRLTIDEFVTELHNIARSCDFDQMYDRMVLQALILGVESDRTRRRLFERCDLRLVDALAICRSQESASRDLRVIDPRSGGDTEEAKMLKYRDKKSETQKRPSHRTTESLGNCTKCATSHPPRSCPAYGQECRKCHKMNHYARCCNARRTGKETGKKESAHQAAEWNYSTDSDEYSNTLTVTKQDRKLLTTMKVWSERTEREVMFQLDTGATCNVLSLRDYQLLRGPRLEKTHTKITCYNGTESTPLGWCYLQAKGKNETQKLKFLVVDVGKQHSLLSMTTCLDMELLHLSETAHLTSTDELDPMLSEYEDVFGGLGQLPGEYRIELSEEVHPIQVRPRKVPLTMKLEVEAELRRLESEGIITKVTQPTEWISHMQPVRKANGSIRICIDPQNLNKAIRRNHVVMPTLDDVLPQLNDAHFFSLCDAKNGFLQVKLAESSTDLTTFWTPAGRYKYLRMPFGISSAPEEFQRRLADTLQGLSGVTVVADDILVFGKDRAEHDANLRDLLERARSSGLRLNKDKCKFLEPELPYIGHLLTQEGVKPDPKKVAAIVDMPSPTSTDGVKRFLGHVTYMSKFIPNLSAESEPMRRLLQNKTFVWSADQENAFLTLKRLLTQADMLQYYDVNSPVVIQTDASTAGLGATLLQRGKPVTYVSRSLTECETKYAPIELETLAIVFALARLDQYVFGHKDVTVQTDHKSLIPIFKKPIFKASRRIQSMLLSLQRYSGMKLVWRPGSEQITADLLSRDSHMEEPSASPGREHMFTVAQEAADRPLPDSTHAELRQETKTDHDLQTLRGYIQHEWPDSIPERLRSFGSFREELTIEDGVIFRGLRAVVPKSMQAAMLNRLHASHQGVKATLRRARLTVYWPRMSEEVTKRCKECLVCLRDAPKQQKEVLRSHVVPTQPWTKVGVDLFEQGHTHYTVVVDYTTDYFEFVKIASQRAKDVILSIKEIFSRMGIPRVLHTDNASYFVSEEFSQFAKQWSFDHTTSSPHYHQSNGKVESAVKICKRILRRCPDPFLALLEHRNTPTEDMSTSPIQRMLGRPTRSTLPQRREQAEADEISFQEKLRKRLKLQSKYNQTARDLPELRSGQPVLVRDYHEHKRGWKEAKVIQQLSGRSYSVEIDGEMRRRNRRDLRPAAQVEQQMPPQDPAPPRSGAVLAAPNPVLPDEPPIPVIAGPRQSSRVHREPVWLKDYIRN